MSTTHCGTNIVRIRVGLFNDILRFDYALRVFFIFATYYPGLTAQRKRSRIPAIAGFNLNFLMRGFLNFRGRIPAIAGFNLNFLMRGFLNFRKW